jgi:L-threonylcarbamoyladenylate synthase
MTTWNPPELKDWAAALRLGQVCAAPAEGVYGYVADPFNLTALQTLLEAKNRAPTKGYIVLVQTTAQLKLLCPPLPQTCTEAIATYWQPGQPPTTLVLPALPTLPPLLTGGLPTIAVRLPQPEYMQTYLQAAGQPIVSTSLNMSGEPPATRAEEVPTDIPALTLLQPLSGTPSRIFNPTENKWLR